LSGDRCEVRVFNPELDESNPFFDPECTQVFETELYSRYQRKSGERKPETERKRAKIAVATLVRNFLKKYLGVDRSFVWALKNQTALRRFVKKDFPDILLTSGPPFGALVLGYFAKRYFGDRIKWVIDFGDPWSFASDKRIFHPVLKFIQFLENKFVSSCDAVIFTTIKTKERYLEHCKARPKVMVLYQGAEGKSEPRIGEQVLSDLVYTGTFYKILREPFELYRVMSRVNMNLVVAGNVDGYFREIPPQISRKVVFLGNLDRPSVMRLQRRAGILVFIDNKNSTQLPGKIFEYLASGRPLLCIGVDKDSPIMEIDFGQYPVVFCDNASEDIFRGITKLMSIELPSSICTLDVSWSSRADQARKFFDELV